MSALTVGQPRRARRIALTAVLLLAASFSSVLPGPLPAQAAAGAPGGVATAIDASFGGGLVTSNLSALDDEAFAVAIQPDGSTVVAGRTNYDRYAFSEGDVLVARYTSAGTLDQGFGQNGSFVMTTPGSTGNAYVVAIQPDGMIVVGGENAGLGIVVRLTADGVLDPGFQGGIVTLPTGTRGVVKALSVQADGSVRVGGGGTRTRWVNGEVLVDTIFQARLNSDGTGDTAFAPGGLLAVDEPANSILTTTMALLADGRLLVAGHTGGGLVGGSPSEVATVARYLSTGELDPSFGTGGLVHVNPDTDFVDRGTKIVDVAVQPDGRIVAVGEELTNFWPFTPPIPGAPPTTPPAPTGLQHTGYANVAVWRFLPDGGLDPSFAATGTVLTRVPGLSGPGSDGPEAQTVPEVDSRGGSVALAADGSIMVGGSSAQPFPEALILRLTPSGLLDTTFGRAGVLSIDMAGPQSLVRAMDFHADGRLAIAGGTWRGWNTRPNYHNLLVARLIPGSNAGKVWTWGWNGLGQLGDGTIADRRVPVAVPGLSGVVSVSASPYHSLALRGDGTVWAWGWNALGQLGDGTTLDRRSPVRVPGLTGVTAIAAGGLHSLALRGDGTVWAWGYNGSGQLGDGTVQMRLSPVRTNIAGITSISAGLFHNLAIREEGSGWAWGYNGLGQLGDGTLVNRVNPVPMIGYGHEAIVKVSAGWLHSSALGARWSGLLWGYDQLGQVSGTPNPSPPTPGNHGPIYDMVAGGYHTLRVPREGTVLPRGWNAFGQLGVGGSPSTPIAGLSIGPVLSAGGLHNLALTSDRRLLAWGWNHYGQLGTGGAGGPVPTVVPLTNPTTMSAGGYHSMAIQG